MTPVESGDRDNPQGPPPGGATVEAQLARSQAASRPIGPPGRVAAKLRAWLRRPDVVADPEQVHDGRVWTRAHDVLPGAVVREGEALTAAWADRVWTVEPYWDPEDLAGLWLVSLDQPSGPPDPADLYPWLDLAPSDTDDAPGASALRSLFEDFQESVKVATDAWDRQRRWASNLLDDLERIAPQTVLELDELETGQHLRALARRPYGFEDRVAR